MNCFDLNTFGFFTQSIPASEFTWDMVCDFALKCYNLFLLYFISALQSLQFRLYSVVAVVLVS